MRGSPGSSAAAAGRACVCSHPRAASGAAIRREGAHAAGAPGSRRTCARHEASAGPQSEQASVSFTRSSTRGGGRWPTAWRRAWRVSTGRATLSTSATRSFRFRLALPAGASVVTIRVSAWRAHWRRSGACRFDWTFSSERAIRRRRRGSRRKIGFATCSARFGRGRRRETRFEAHTSSSSTTS